MSDGGGGSSSLRGHVLPGSIFILLSLMWTFDLFLTHFDSKDRSIGRWKRRKWLELCLRTTAILTGVTAHLWSMFMYTSQGMMMEEELLHLTMFAFFLLPTALEMMYLCQVPGCQDWMHLMCLSLAFAVEALLFWCHLGGDKSPLHQQVHGLLVLAAAACSLSAAAEACWPEDIRLRFARSCFTLLQGLWLPSIGLMLHWVRRDLFNKELAAAVFVWELVAVILLQFLTALFAYKLTKRKEGYAALAQQDDCLE